MFVGLWSVGIQNCDKKDDVPYVMSCHITKHQIIMFLQRQATTTSVCSVPMRGVDLVSMRRVSGGVVSSNQQMFAFSVKELHADNELFDATGDAQQFTTRLYVQHVSDSSSCRRLTNPPRGKVDTNPVWQDSDTLLFLSNRAGAGMQVWKININGGEACQVTNVPVSVGDLSCCAGWMYFSASTHVDAVSLDESAARKPDPKGHMKFTKLPIRAWDTWTDRKRSHLFCLAPGEEKEPEDLMRGLDADCPVPPFGGAEHYSVAPNGDVAYMTSLNNTSSTAWSTETHIFVRTVSNNNVVIDICPQAKGCNSNPLFSPDGKNLVYLSMERAGFEADRNRIMLYNLSSGTTRELSAPSWKPAVAEVVWAPDGKSLVVSATEYGRHRLYTLDIPIVEGEEAKLESLVAHGACSEPCFIDSDTVLFKQSTSERPHELFKVSLSDRRCVQLTSFNDATTRKFAFGEMVDLEFQGGGDETVHALLYLPADYDESESYPLACAIHGGPQGAWTDSWHYRWNPQYLVSHGFAVLCVNFHGSPGYGQAFTDAVSKDWGGKPYEDIMRGCDAALEKYSALDPKRQVAYGASYGGFMINWINGHTDRFRALVNHDGIFNQESMYYETEELFFAEWEMNGMPSDSSSLYDKWSPHKFVQNWKTPTLVVHGGKDYRVCETQGIATFQALQRMGVPSEFLYFPEENHWVLSPSNSIVWHAEVLAWLQKFTTTTK